MKIGYLHHFEQNVSKHFIDKTFLNKLKIQKLKKLKIQTLLSVSIGKVYRVSRNFLFPVFIIYYRFYNSYIYYILKFFNSYIYYA